MNHFSDKVNLIWDIADTLRGPYRPPEYRKVMLPMTVLRRLDCVLAPTKPQVLATQKKWSNKAADALLRKAACQSFYNTSKLDFDKLRGAPDNIAQDLLRYIRSFSPNVRAIFNSFGFDDQIAKLDKANRLFLIVSKFAAVDLHPDAVPNHHMGLVFEELVRKFNEVANEEAGDHFTPREVIKLMVNILFDPDDATLTKKGIIRTLYDPTCGTGGMLTTASERLQQLNPDAQLVLFGQDYNPEAYAICCADAKSLALPYENRADLEQLIEDYYQQHRPASPDARSFVDDLIRCEWTLRRLDRAETQMWRYQNEDEYRDPEKFPLGKSLSLNPNSFSRLQYRVDATRRARMRALQALKQLQAESTPAPPVEPDPPALDPPSLPPSPQTTSPQIGFVPPLAPQLPGTDKTGMSFRRTLPETRCQSCLSPVSPSSPFPVTIPVAASLA
jgi:hypothetical protein